jgi:hypothetical protein
MRRLENVDLDLHIFGKRLLHQSCRVDMPCRAWSIAHGRHQNAADRGRNELIRLSLLLLSLRSFAPLSQLLFLHRCHSRQRCVCETRVARSGKMEVGQVARAVASHVSFLNPHVEQHR